MNRETAVELYIDTGDGEENKRILDALAAKRADVETAFGASLSWDRMDEKRGSRIRFVLKQGGLLDEEQWPVTQDAMIEAMDKLSRALKPYFARI